MRVIIKECMLSHLFASDKRTALKGEEENHKIVCLQLCKNTLLRFNTKGSLVGGMILLCNIYIKCIKIKDYFKFNLIHYIVVKFPQIHKSNRMFAEDEE